MPFDGTYLSETAKVLIAARERVERGWCRGAGRSRDGVCTVVALADSAMALGDIETFIDAHLLMSRIVDRSLSGWNDDKDHTKEEVLALFDLAIEIELKQWKREAA